MLKHLYLSIFFQKLFNAEQLAFSTLLRRFYAKMDDECIELKGKLDFMLGISENIDQVKTKLGRRYHGIYSSQIEKSLQMITYNRTIIRSKIESIDKSREVKIYNLCNKIRSQISMKISNPNFLNSFVQWDQNPVDVEHLKRVKSLLSDMKSEYDELHKQFSKHMRLILAVSANIDKDILSVNTFFKQLLRPNYSRQAKRNTQLVETMIDKITKQQSDLIQNLNQILKVVNIYNNQRYNWATLLIGMEKLPSTSALPHKHDSPIDINDLQNELYSDSENNNRIK